MSGEVAEVNVKGDKDTAKVMIRVVDKTYVVLNRLYTFAYTASAGKTAPERS